MTATVSHMPRIDTRHIVDELEDIIELLEALDGVDVTDTDPSKKIKVGAEVSREFLFIHHRIEKAAVDVMELYHSNRRAR